jgi:Cu-processing system permease protein
MSNALWAVARNTFRETIRDRVLYSLIAFGVLVIAASLLAGSVSLGQELRVVQNFGLTAMLAFLLVITIFVGTQLVWREIERKTIYLVLSKPITREVFYLGKFVGLAMTIAVVTAIMGAVFLALVAFSGGQIGSIHIAAIILMMLEAWLLIALGMLFSSFTLPLTGAVYTFSLALIGHASTSLLILSTQAKAPINYILQTVYYLFPNLEKFNLRNEVVFAAAIDGQFIGFSLLYFAAYTGALLLLGLAIIRKYEF